MTDSAPVVPVSLKAGPSELHVAWSDGREDVFPFRLLRDCCPCATCKVAREEARPQEPELLPVLSPQEAQPLRIASMQPVGNYAYAVAFTDGHNSGIYTIEFLRRLGDELLRA